MSFIRGTEYANKLNSWHNNLEEDRQQRARLFAAGCLHILRIPGFAI